MLESSAVLNASAATANASGNGGEVLLAADAANTGTGTLVLNVGAQINVGAAAPNAGVSGPVFGGSVTFATTRYAVSSTSTNTIATGTQTFTVQTGLRGISAGETITLADRADNGQSMTGTVSAYDPATGTLVVNVTSLFALAALAGKWSQRSCFRNRRIPGPRPSTRSTVARPSRRSSPPSM
jgi:hypothetical protein